MKSFFGWAARVVLGRKLLLRISRFMLNEARLDYSNSMYQNGELLLQREVLLQHAKKTVVIFDVGANAGEWSQNLLKLSVKYHASVSLHCFEPSAYTHKILSETLAPYEQLVTLRNLALSNRIGEDKLYIAGEGLGINSLYQHGSVDESQNYETIVVTTLDQYCMDMSIDAIHFLKIDAEGHDCKVILGARRMLMEEKIDVIQFEYSWRWLASRQYLKDIFDLVKGTTYTIGKLTKYGIEIYSKWDLDLETFTEGNYVLLKGKELSDFPRVKWWKN